MTRFRKLLSKVLSLITQNMTEVKYINCRDALSMAYPDRRWLEDDLEAIRTRWDRYAEGYWQARTNSMVRRGQNEESLVRVADGLWEIVRIVREWKVEEQLQAIRRLQARLKDLDMDEEDLEG